jgi:serine/threonine protein kinase
LHGQGVLYRDVTPDNIVVVAGHASLDSGLLELPPGISLRATPAYMAPEMWGSKPGARSDQYSLAISYAEMRVGYRPFSGGSIVEIMHAHLKDAPDLARLPESEQQVLLKALAKDPEQRWPSCLRLVQELERAVAD